MKKMLTAVLAFALCLAMAACGVNKQPTIDAFNATSQAFSEVANTINKDPAAFDQSVIDAMTQMSQKLQSHAQALQSEQLTAQQLDAMREAYAEIDAWVALVKDTYGIE